jgi:hypothetical protein
MARSSTLLALRPAAGFIFGEPLPRPDGSGDAEFTRRMLAAGFEAGNAVSGAVKEEKPGCDLDYCGTMHMQHATGPDLRHMTL